jgi:hypothetical protein
MIITDPAKGRLRGRAIFVSASVPDLSKDPRFRPGENSHIEVEEAVVSLARAVFSEGGRLVFGGHPSISPLVALVAGEYHPYGQQQGDPEGSVESGPHARPPVIIYQSGSFESVAPAVTRVMEMRGLATICWTQPSPSEGIATRQSGSITHSESLHRMRVRMIAETKPIGMVCIGGMGGVLEEAQLFAEHRRGAPVYAIERTGGAAELLASEPGLLGMEVRVIDRGVLDQLTRLQREYRTDAASDRGDLQEIMRTDLTPYPLIMQMLVRELIGERGLIGEEEDR